MAQSCFMFINIVACRPVARRRPRDRQLYTAAIARQWPANIRGMMLSARSAKQQLNRNRNSVFCAVRAVIA
jgi:hypothetical protein